MTLRLARRGTIASSYQAGFVFGAYVESLPLSLTDLTTLETTVGHPMGVGSYFTDWAWVFGGSADAAIANGGARKVLASWEIGNNLSPDRPFTTVTNGDWDSYFDQVVTSMLAYPGDIYVRPWAEMNGHWSLWQPTASGPFKKHGGTYAEFIAAWQYVVDYFRTRDVYNLKFIFNPDCSNHLNNTAISDIWPGGSYVDVLGIDGYNWGITTDGPNDGHPWYTVSQIFTTMYGILLSQPGASGKEVWICETACKEPEVQDAPNAFTTDVSPVDNTNDKGVWITDLFNTVPVDFPAVTTVCWFNAQKERDWHLDSSPSGSSLTAIQAALAG